MNCPSCGFNDLKVLDSRPGSDGESIKRRRQCPNCSRRYTSWERIERNRLFVIKRDGSRTDFSREKIFDSMRIACRKRPVDLETIQAAVGRIEEELHRKFDDEVSTQQIGLVVMRELATIDTVAYVRFASVYQEFETLTDFAELVERVQTEQALAPFRSLQQELISLPIPQDEQL